MTKINFTVTTQKIWRRYLCRDRKTACFFFSLPRYRKKRQSVCIATYIGITRRTVLKQQNEAKVVWTAAA